MDATPLVQGETIAMQNRQTQDLYNGRSWSTEAVHQWKPTRDSHHHPSIPSSPPPAETKPPGLPEIKQEPRLKGLKRMVQWVQKKATPGRRAEGKVDLDGNWISQPKMIEVAHTRLLLHAATVYSLPSQESDSEGSIIVVSVPQSQCPVIAAGNKSYPQEHTKDEDKRSTASSTSSESAPDLRFSGPEESPWKSSRLTKQGNSRFLAKEVTSIPTQDTPTAQGVKTVAKQNGRSRVIRRVRGKHVYYVTPSTSSVTQGPTLDLLPQRTMSQYFTPPQTPQQSFSSGDSQHRKRESFLQCNTLVPFPSKAQPHEGRRKRLFERDERDFVELWQNRNCPISTRPLPKYTLAADVNGGDAIAARYGFA
ncbi:hypothetical protein BKA70DRAFT_1433254 [Coprinopsis sp. MPI-PUGE-AT-0042]|nr:hypothetical protein BKA70DRAFT_1433254 [Coprinopsis sp. MPI-PUGE-AT-0042]